MRAVIQRVKHAHIKVDGATVADIGVGFLVLLGIETMDNAEDITWLAKKISNLRVFGDEEGAMNRSLLDVDGEVIVVSQFTLHALTKKGNRPSFIKAARPEQAEPQYLDFVKALEIHLGKKVQTGIFGADMKVTLLNDGPVTIFMDTKNRE
ncbi:MAG: D-aminoacyl-tRNA deacylase [Bacteroidota bacterium]